jgi:peptidoglycan/LPS O-acetylase OafA/YrhL
MIWLALGILAALGFGLMFFGWVEKPTNNEGRDNWTLWQ